MTDESKKIWPLIVADLGAVADHQVSSRMELTARQRGLEIPLHLDMSTDWLARSIKGAADVTAYTAGFLTVEGIDPVAAHGLHRRSLELWRDLESLSIRVQARMREASK